MLLCGAAVGSGSADFHGHLGEPVYLNGHGVVEATSEHTAFGAAAEALGRPNWLEGLGTGSRCSWYGAVGDQSRNGWFPNPLSVGEQTIVIRLEEPLRDVTKVVVYDEGARGFIKRVALGITEPHADLAKPVKHRSCYEDGAVLWECASEVSIHTNPEQKLSEQHNPPPDTNPLPFAPDMDYRGVTAVTTDGKTCQKWSLNYPVAHPYLVGAEPKDGKTVLVGEDALVGTGVADHNYCRNLDGDPKGAWCLTGSCGDFSYIPYPIAEYVNVNPRLLQSPCKSYCTIPPPACDETPTSIVVADVTEPVLWISVTLGWGGNAWTSVDAVVVEGTTLGACFANDTHGYWREPACTSCVANHTVVYKGPFCNETACQNVTCRYGDCAPVDDEVASNGTCVCFPGYYGADCSLQCPINYAAVPVDAESQIAQRPDLVDAQVICFGHGQCSNGVSGSGLCTCDAGYAGSDCSKACPGMYTFSDGGIEVCTGHGTCSQGALADASCTCSFGYFGPACAQVLCNGVECFQGECVDRATNSLCDAGDLSGACFCACNGADSAVDGSKGFWAGQKCERCATGYVGEACMDKKRSSKVFHGSIKEELNIGPLLFEMCTEMDASLTLVASESYTGVLELSAGDPGSTHSLTNQLSGCQLTVTPFQKVKACETFMPSVDSQTSESLFIKLVPNQYVEYELTISYHEACEQKCQEHGLCTSVNEVTRTIDPSVQDRAASALGDVAPTAVPEEKGGDDGDGSTTALLSAASAAALAKPTRRVGGDAVFPVDECAAVYVDVTRDRLVRVRHLLTAYPSGEAPHPVFAPLFDSFHASDTTRGVLCVAAVRSGAAGRGRGGDGVIALLNETASSHVRIWDYRGADTATALRVLAAARVFSRARSTAPVVVTLGHGVPAAVAAAIKDNCKSHRIASVGIPGREPGDGRTCSTVWHALELEDFADAPEPAVPGGCVVLASQSYTLRNEQGEPAVLRVVAAGPRSHLEFAPPTGGVSLCLSTVGVGTATQGSCVYTRSGAGYVRNVQFHGEAVAARAAECGASHFSLRRDELYHVSAHPTHERDWFVHGSLARGVRDGHVAESTRPGRVDVVRVAVVTVVPSVCDAAFYRRMCATAESVSRAGSGTLWLVHLASARGRSLPADLLAVLRSHATTPFALLFGVSAEQYLATNDAPASVVHVAPGARPDRAFWDMAHRSAQRGETVFLRQPCASLEAGDVVVGAFDLRSYVNDGHSAAATLASHVGEAYADADADSVVCAVRADGGRCGVYKVDTESWSVQACRSLPWLNTPVPANPVGCHALEAASTTALLAARGAGSGPTLWRTRIALPNPHAHAAAQVTLQDCDSGRYLAVCAGNTLCLEAAPVPFWKQPERTGGNHTWTTAKGLFSLVPVGKAMRVGVVGRQASLVESGGLWQMVTPGSSGAAATSIFLEG